jgi:predicted glutamine amidotransferase
VFGKKFLKVDELLEALKDYPKERPLVLHFRLATHGESSLGSCHPFPFPFGKVEDLFEPSWKAQLGVMHNGVISGYGTRKSYGCSTWDEKTRTWKKVEGKKKERELSDTQEFLLYLATDRQIRDRLAQWDSATLKLLEMTTLDKWALMNGNGKVRMLGKWEQRKAETGDRCWYSNLYWESAIGQKEFSAYGGRSYGEGWEDWTDGEWATWRDQRLGVERKEVGPWTLEGQVWVRRGSNGKVIEELKEGKWRKVTEASRKEEEPGKVEVRQLACVCS